MPMKLVDLSDLIGLPLDEIREDLKRRIEGLLEDDEPRFPCQNKPMEDAPPRLLHLLYHLLRDELFTGDLERILASQQSGDARYSNPHLEALARAYCTHLVGEEQDTMARAMEVLNLLQGRLEAAGFWTEETQGLAALDKAIEQAKITDQPLLGAIGDQLDRYGCPGPELDVQSRIVALIAAWREAGQENDRLARDHQADRVKLERYRTSLEMMRQYDADARTDHGVASGFKRLPEWYREQLAVALGEIPANDAQG